jgi:hypothetical protein
VRVRSLLPMALGLLLAGCGSSSTAPPPTATPQPASATPAPRGTPSGTVPTGAPTATVTVSRTYAAFVTSLCQDFATKNADGVIKALPYYQYNSGLRWGMMGDGEGSTSDPSLMRTWLASAHVHCTFFTPDKAGHGTVLATGWTQPAPSALAEVDIYPDGHWKINDFTFGKKAVLYTAMQTAGTPLRFRG